MQSLNIKAKRTEQTCLLETSITIFTHNLRTESDKMAENKKLVAQPANLNSLIAYQEGSVVSRTIIDKKAGTVTVLAFDKGEGLSEHTTPYDALVYIIDGEVEVTISGKPIRLKKDEVTIMPANEPHALSAVTKFKMLLVMIKS
jgi:quercetin dioxygenase-like cupin family protein